MAYGPSGAMSLSYDGQNRLIKAGNDSFAYDPAGHREWKLIGPDHFINTGSNNDEYYLYDLSGHRVGTYKFTATINPPQGYFTAIERDYWFGSRLIYRWTPGGAGPVMQDRLGSVRADSGTGSAVYSGFYPYGEEKGSATANDRVKFGTYRRDGDTGLDYAENRYYSSAMGRFLRPDPFGGSADVGVPQSWNRYGYALNDPADSNDPTGQFLYCTGPNGENGQAACTPIFKISVTAPADPTPTNPSPDQTYQASNRGTPPSTNPGQPGPSLSGGGSSAPVSTAPIIPPRYWQTCQSLAQSIANKRQMLQNKAWEIKENPKELRIGRPGDPIWQTQWGHLEDYVRLKQLLEDDLTEWNNKCGGGDPPSVPPNLRPVQGMPSDFKIPDWLLYGIGGVAAASFCAVLPEICIGGIAFAPAF